MTSRIIRRTKTSCLLLSLLLNNSSNAFTVPSSSLSSSSRLNTELSYSIIEASKGDNNDNNSNNNNNNNGVKPKWSPSGGGGGGGGGSGIGFGAGSIGGAAAGGTPDFTTSSMSASSSPAAASSGGGGDDYYAAEMKRREAQTKTGNVKKSSSVPSSGAAAGGTPDFTFGSTTSSTSASAAAASPAAGGSPAASSSSTFPSFGGSSAGASSAAGPGAGSSFGASSSSSSTTPNFSSTSASTSAGPAGGSPSFGSSSSTTPSFSSGTSSIPGPAGSTPNFGASSSSSPNNSFGGASAAGGGAPSFSSASSPSSSFGSSTVPGPSSSSSSIGSSSSSTSPNNVNNNNFQDPSNNSFPPPPPSSNTEEEKKEEEELPQGMVKAELNGAKDINAAFTQKFKNDVFVNGKRQETTSVENDDEYERRKMNSYAMNSNNNNNNYRNNNDRRGGRAESLSNIPEGTSLEEENRLLRELAMRLEREQAELTGRRTESRIPNMSRGGRSSQPRPQQQQIRRASAAANVASSAPPRYNERHYPRNPRHTAFANVQNKMVARTDEELRAKQMEAEMNSPAFRMEGDMNPPAFFDNMDKRRQFMDVGNRNKVRSNLALARANRKLIQGKTLLTWSFMSPSVRQVQVKLTTDGRPIDAEVELWDGPDNIPHKMKIYSESGYEHPFHAILATPGGFDTVAVRNVGDMEFPVKGQVLPVSDERNGPMGVMIDTANAAAEYYMDDDQPMGPETERPQTIQGGALRSFTYGPEVESIQVLLKTQGRPIQAKIELIQGPNNNKEVIEIYTQNGEQYPFYGVFESMGRGSVIRIINTAPLEFPITVLTSPYKINYQNSHRQMAPIIR